MPAEIISGIDAVPAKVWNSLAGTDQPFLRHEFLLALETSGSVGPGTGWNPAHLLLKSSAGVLNGAMPLYLKTDSWGEFVFDFAWADAYRRAGLNYYPKLVAGVPFTPATGPRFLTAKNVDRQATITELLSAARAATEQLGASSIHLLFPTEKETEQCKLQGFLVRKDCQFHWHNKNYESFDEFLNEFTAAKRKKVRRERRRVRESGIRFRHLSGHELSPDVWREIMPLYASSFLRRGREPYLNKDFFLSLGQTLPDKLLVILAQHKNRVVATAICLRSDNHLYGRYWGSDGYYHSLHFETCYYQGIDYCIRERLGTFEPGTQGEHKISRGFVPTATWSAHWLSHPQFLAAVDDYLGREREHIDGYIDAVNAHVPYRKTND